MSRSQINIGIIGTSWWTDSMYLPALAGHPRAAAVAVCGRDRGRAEALARRWGVPRVHTDYRRMLQTDNLDAVIIASANDTHHPAAMDALQRGLHVLCEKPLALTVAEAAEMAQTAAQQGAVTMVPFTYRFMPSNQFLKELLDNNYIGRPYHLAMRYYTGFGRTGVYHWRFDKAKAGSGVIGDLGSHFLHLAEWFYGGITAVTCQAAAMVKRDPAPDGAPYEQMEDTAAFLLEFAGGARGVVTVSSLAHEPTPFGQRHQMEFHGDGGTLYAENDWDKTEIVRGARHTDAALARLEIPARHTAGARRDSVHNTYRDMFRKARRMTGDWVDAIAAGRPVKPDFADGLRVQRVMEAALRSAAEGRRVTVDGGDGEGKTGHVTV